MVWRLLGQATVVLQDIIPSKNLFVRANPFCILASFMTSVFFRVYKADSRTRTDFTGIFRKQM